MTCSTPARGDVHVLRLVAHELRAHLTVLNGYSELLLDDPRVRSSPERTDVALREIRTHLATLTEISNHLTDVVRGVAGTGLPLAVTDFDLSAAGHEALDMAAEVARRHRVRLVLDDRTLGDTAVRGDRFQLVTAMRNLLDNACTHGPADGDVVLLLGRRQGEVHVATVDQGQGLDGIGAAAFEPLRRGDAGDSSPAGLGVGLSLVAEVARAHGGRVTWHNARGGASSIGLCFPDRAQP